MIDKGLISKIHKQLIQLNTKKTKQPNQNMGRRPNRHFFKEDTQRTNRYMKRLLIIREMQIKTTVMYYLTVRVAIIKKSTNKKMLERVWRKSNPQIPLRECKLVQPLWRTERRFFKKLKIDLPYGQAILLLGIYPGKMKTLI